MKKAKLKKTKLKKYRVILAGLVLAVIGHYFVGWHMPWSFERLSIKGLSSKVRDESIELSLFSRVHESTLENLNSSDYKVWSLPKGILVGDKRVHLGNLDSIAEYSDPLRHVEEMEGFNETGGILGRLYNERPYAQDSGPYFDPKMKFVNSEDNPFRHLTPREVQLMEDARKQEFKDWTKSTIRDETRNLVTDADRDAAPIHAAWTLRGVLGSGDLFNADEVRGRKAEQKRRRERVSITAEEKAAEARDPEVARLSLIGQPAPENKDDEVRLKSKLNLSRRLGRLELKNPLIVPAAQVDFRSSERLEVRAAKELKSLETETSVSYGIEHKTLAMNLNKKITDEISCELKSTKSTLPQVVNEEALKLNYRIHF